MRRGQPERLQAQPGSRRNRRGNSDPVDVRPRLLRRSSRGPSDPNEESDPLAFERGRRRGGPPGVVLDPNAGTRETTPENADECPRSNRHPGVGAVERLFEQRGGGRGRGGEEPSELSEPLAPERRSRVADDRDRIPGTRRSIARRRPVHEGVELGAQTDEMVHARELVEHRGGNEVRHDPVVLPETDEPQKSSVRVSVEARARTIRAAEGEPQLSDLTDSRRRSLGNGLARNGFARRYDDAFRIHVFQNSPVPPRVPGGTEWCAGRPSREGPEPSLPRTRPTAGAPQGWGGRAPAVGRKGAQGRLAPPRSGPPRRVPRASLAGGVLEGPLVLRADAGHWAVRAVTGSRNGTPLVRRRGSGPGRLGGASEARRGPPRSATGPSGRVRSEAEGTTGTPQGIVARLRSGSSRFGASLKTEH